MKVPAEIPTIVREALHEVRVIVEPTARLAECVLRGVNVDRKPVRVRRDQSFRPADKANVEASVEGLEKVSESGVLHSLQRLLHRKNRVEVHQEVRAQNIGIENLPVLKDSRRNLEHL